MARARLIATDIGGGSSYSLLRTLDEAYKIQQLRGHRLPPIESFWQATRGNAEALGLVERIGTLEPGSDADIIVLDAAARPRPWPSGWKQCRRWKRSCSCCRRWATTGQCSQVYIAGQSVQL
jgi:cytosine/adenosine deaminase-related metal-dependent hydrolase